MDVVEEFGSGDGCRDMDGNDSGEKVGIEMVVDGKKKKKRTD